MARRSLIPLLILVLGASFSSCTAFSSLPPGCYGKDLLLEESFFAAGSTTSGILSPLPEGTRHSAGTTIYLGRGIVVQQIFPYSSYQRAIDEYQERLRDPVFTNQAKSGWVEPDEKKALDIQADNYELACGEQNGIPMCRSILQHGRYYIYLNAHTYQNEFSALDFVKMINEIDSRVLGCSR